MAGLIDDSGFKVIDDGLKVDITNAIENGRWRAALVLIYSAMDTMAFLDLPSGETDVRARDFIAWAERYVRFPCHDQLTGEDLYGARCGLLHSSRIVSTLFKKGKCRLLGYADDAPVAITFRPAVEKNFVMVSIRALQHALFEGINTFLIHAYANPIKAKLITGRIEQMVQYFPVDGSKPTEM